MTLLAEDLLILLLDDAKGTTSTWVTTDIALGGAVLAELALLGLATVDEKKGFWSSAKVRATGPAPADLHPVLAETLAAIAAKARPASTLVTKLGKGLDDRLAAGLAERRILERRDGRLLGVLPRTTWPAADTTRDNQLRRSITVCLVDGGRPDERTAALIGLLSAVDQAHKAVTTNHAMTTRQLKKRAKEIAEGNWAAKAVKDALAAAASSSAG
jgi:Golgi phosphoprotein 3 GPP34